MRDVCDLDKLEYFQRFGADRWTELKIPDIATNSHQTLCVGFILVDDNVHRSQFDDRSSFGGSKNSAVNTNMS